MNTAMKTDDFSRAFLDLKRDAGKSVTLTVATGSMMPLIRPGDRVLVRLGNGNNVKPGDMVAYLERDKVFVHRLMKIEKGKGARVFRQKGDALSGWGVFDDAAFLGRVDVVYRGEAVLQMNRMPWRFFNGALGGAGRLKSMVVTSARRIKYRIAGDWSPPLLKWVVMVDAAGGRLLKRFLIGMMLILSQGTARHRNLKTEATNSKFNLEKP